MSRTVPQMIMLSHASKVNQERSEKRWALKRGEKPEPEPEEEEPTFLGKPLSKLNSQEMKMYYGSFFAGGG